MAIGKPEILAPAGSRAALEAAVRSGADAVYLGATELNARKSAENFNEVQLQEAVCYCHIRGVKVYLTLNVLLKQRELNIGVEIARAAQRAGIDGIILQDLGLSCLIHTALPQLPLHASTQMSVTSAAALPALKELGFCRVVAAREMNAEELKELCDKAAKLGMTVEVFIHGALCMSVSGQCLLSAMLGGRSGNRGLCAQPCRLPFSVANGTGNDLSLKDLSLLKYLHTLQKMGVASFKIEGRMKRPEYVAAAVCAAKSALECGNIPEPIMQSLTDIFSRSGFTNGYFTGSVGRNMFGIRTKENAAAAGMAIPSIHEYYRTERQSVPIKIMAEFSVLGAYVSFSDNINTVSVTGEPPQQSRIKALDKETAESYLTKLGGTPYYAESVSVKVENELFMRGADLNAMRRSAVQKLNAARAAVLPKAECEYKLNHDYYYPARRPALIIRLDNISQLPSEITGIEAIALRAEEMPPDNIPEGLQLIADIPRGLRSGDISEQLRAFKAKGCKAALCGDLGGIDAAKKAGLSPIGNVGMNITNSESVSVLKRLGCKATIISPELYLSEIIKTDTAIPKGIFAYGRLPLMLTRNCPVKNGTSCTNCGRTLFVTDRRGIKFPIKCRAGYSELLNSVPIYLADKLDETNGLDFLLLFFTDESPEQIRSIVTAYKRGSRKPPAEYTRGLYYRTVK